MEMNDTIDARKLQMPEEVTRDQGSLELVSVWFSKGKVKVLTRDGTPLDQRLDIWAEVVAGVIRNIADHASGYDSKQSPNIERQLATMVREQIVRNE
jgi:Domain of unknown function (DUF5076)